jgi:O-antigen ligase
MLVVLAPVVSYPFSWLLPGWTPYRSALHLPVGVLAVSAGLVLFVVGAPLRGRSGSHDTPVAPGRALPRALAPVLACLLSLIVATLVSPFPEWSVAVLPGSVAALGVLVLGASLPTEKVRSLLWCGVAVGVAVAGNGLVRLEVEPEFVSTIGNRNVLAAYLAASGCLAVGLAGDTRYRWPVGLATVAVMVPAIYLCQSRSAWLGLVFAGIVVLTFAGRGGRWAAAVFGLAVVAGGLWWSARNGSADVRPVIWRSTLRMVADRPVAGHGLGQFTAAYPPYRDPEYFTRPKAAPVTNHPHNELLLVAAEQGLLGVVATVWLWGTCLWHGWRAARDNPLYRGVLAAVIVWLVHGMLDIGLWAPPTQPVFWLWLGLLAGNSALTREPTRGLLTGAASRLAVTILAGWLFWSGFLQPLRADWHERRAQVASRIGEPVRAITAAERALEIQPYRLGTRYFLAELLARAPSAETRAAAIEQCELLRQWAPDYAEVNLHLAELYRVSGQPEKARARAARAVELNPHDPRAQAVLDALGDCR